MKVTEGVLNGFDMLIGMDIITSGDFCITNVGGTTSFSFRVPSIKEIDFVKESQDEPGHLPKAPNRNDLCYCGSGKKYKHCHGKK